MEAVSVERVSCGSPERVPCRGFLVGCRMQGTSAGFQVRGLIGGPQAGHREGLSGNGSVVVQLRCTKVGSVGGPLARHCGGGHLKGSP
jgi:hypothetical protein